MTVQDFERASENKKKRNVIKNDLWDFPRLSFSSWNLCEMALQFHFFFLCFIFPFAKKKIWMRWEVFRWEQEQVISLHPVSFNDAKNEKKERNLNFFFLSFSTMKKKETFTAYFIISDMNIFPLLNFLPFFPFPSLG